MLATHKGGDMSCCPTLRYHYRFSRAADEDILKAQVSLQEVQHALALDYGFKSWKELSANARRVGTADRSSSAESIVTELIHEAVVARASDIHIEWINGHLVVRYRVEGRFRGSITNIPDNLQTGVVATIKQMAGLDSEQNNLLQNGRILTEISGTKVQLRVSVMPYVAGESTVVRILYTDHLRVSLEQLGLTAANTATIRNWMQRPGGLFFVVGPGGSGKTTTLYSVLLEMNPEERKIVTCEDPVEYVIDGINQQQVDNTKGITILNTMREIIKQDPDVIMVSETRDLDTLNFCLQLALTGHLVFSALHASDAARGVNRLLDLGVEPYLLSSSLLGVLGQRLVFRICDNCREEYRPGLEVLQRFSNMADARFYKGRGCDKCNNTGYRGKVGILEMLEMDDDLRAIIERKGSAAELREQAIKSGMIRMREDGLEKVAQGITTIDEVLRVTLGDAD